MPVIPYAGSQFLHKHRIEPYFREREYGPRLPGIFLVFMGRVEEHRQRRKISKKNQKHYLDIMLPVFPILFSPPEERIRLFGACMREQLAASLRKYKFKPDEFDTERFIADLDAWMDQTRMLRLTPEEAEPYALLPEHCKLSSAPTSILRSFGVQHDECGRILSTIDDVDWEEVRRWRKAYNNKLWRDKEPHYPGWPENMPN